MKKLTLLPLLAIFVVTETASTAAKSLLKRKQRAVITPIATSTEKSPDDGSDSKSPILVIPGWGGMQSRPQSHSSSPDSSASSARISVSRCYQSPYPRSTPVEAPPIERRAAKRPFYVAPFKNTSTHGLVASFALPSSTNPEPPTVNLADIMIPYGYGWMQQHPLVLLKAALNNPAYPDDKAKKMHQVLLRRAVNSANTAEAAKALTNGANPNKVDATGWSPLHYACADARCTDIVKLMITHGADIHKVTKQNPAHPELAYGCTPLEIAVANKHVDIIALLLEHGAVVTPISISY